MKITRKMLKSAIFAWQSANVKRASSPVVPRGGAGGDARATFFAFAGLRSSVAESCSPALLLNHLPSLCAQNYPPNHDAKNSLEVNEPIEGLRRYSPENAPVVARSARHDRS